MCASGRNQSDQLKLQSSGSNNSLADDTELPRAVPVRPHTARVLYIFYSTIKVYLILSYLIHRLTTSPCGIVGR